MSKVGSVCPRCALEVQFPMASLGLVVDEVTGIGVCRFKCPICGPVDKVAAAPVVSRLLRHGATFSMLRTAEPLPTPTGGPLDEDDVLAFLLSLESDEGPGGVGVANHANSE